jgi:hypothetical protein
MQLLPFHTYHGWWLSQNHLARIKLSRDSFAPFWSLNICIYNAQQIYVTIIFPASKATYIRFHSTLWPKHRQTNAPRQVKFKRGAVCTLLGEIDWSVSHRKSSIPTVQMTQKYCSRKANNLLSQSDRELLSSRCIICKVQSVTTNNQAGRPVPYLLRTIVILTIWLINTDTAQGKSFQSLCLQALCIRRRETELGLTPS